MDEVVTLAREATPHGEVALRRRGAVLELVVDGAFAMDTVDTSTEERLATVPLARHPAPRRVLVGGLGLGATTRALLADPRVVVVDVVELAEPLVRWARTGLVAELAGLEGERCRLHVGDVAEVLTDVTGAGGPEGAPGPWDLVLLDVDNGPDFLVHAGNARLYGPRVLAAARARLAPRGVLVVWSSHVAPHLLAALRAVAAEGDLVAEEVLPVQREGRSFEYALYLLERGAARGGDDGAVRRDLVIRPEHAEDADAVRALLDAAFPVPQGADHSPEADLVDGLRADGDLLPELTFVAELDGDVAGYVACSRATMGEGPSVGLGPLAVRPALQRGGIGSALVAAVVATAEQRGEPSVVLLGDPAYYGAFGFETAAPLGVGSPGPWEDRYFQVLRLRAWHPGLAGPFRYAAAFDRLPD